TMNKIYDKNDITGQYLSFKMDDYVNLDAEQQAVLLGNIQLDSAGSTYALPNMLTFLDMFGVGKIEQVR
ncbi:MAG: hypothetical protein ACOYIB_06825, partial [Desulfosporosinus sp.]